MDINKIKELALILDEYNLSKIKIKENETLIHLEKEVNVVSAMPVNNVIENVSDASPSKVVANTINSPIVGTFYSRPNPEADAYVNVNQRVKAGDVICIIEAMKVMNEIKADIDGVIKEILVKDGDVVEFDQPLFVIG